MRIFSPYCSSVLPHSLHLTSQTVLFSYGAFLLLLLLLFDALTNVVWFCWRRPIFIRRITRWLHTRLTPSRQGGQKREVFLSRRTQRRDSAELEIANYRAAVCGRGWRIKEKKKKKSRGLVSAITVLMYRDATAASPGVASSRRTQGRDGTAAKL